MSQLSQKTGRGDEYRSKKRRFFVAMPLLKKIVAYILIIALMVVDSFTLYISFTDIADELNWYELVVCCITVAFCLEGLPAYLGIAIYMFIDKKSFGKNDRTVSLVAMIICGIVTLLVFGFLIGQRLTTPMIGTSTFQQNMNELLGKTQEITFLQKVLAWLPLATSTLSFVISWIGLAPDRLADQERKVDACYDKYEQCKSSFQKTLGELRNARISLWIALDATSKVPQKLHIFYKEVYAKARSKIIEDSLISYPLQLTRFNSAVRGELEVFISEMCMRSTVPLAISNINIDDILKEYDERQVVNERTEDIWNHNQSIKMLKTELQQILDNAVIVAQSKTYSYYPLEEEREL